MTPRTAEDCDRLIEAIRYPNLFTCTPLNARITERACLSNQARWQHERHEPLRPCGECAAGKAIVALNDHLRSERVCVVTDWNETDPLHLPSAPPTIRRIQTVQSEPEAPWTPYGERTCKRCGELEYGISGLCFTHMRAAIGPPYHYSPGEELKRISGLIETVQKRYKSLVDGGLIEGVKPWGGLFGSRIIMRRGLRHE